MSLRMLSHFGFIRPDAPTIAQQVETLVGRQIDGAVNDPDAPVALVLYGLALETALTVEHFVELFVVRPLVGRIVRVLG
ncbi:hypothetical protein SEA_CHRIS_49 [Mycobacterium phage Chris]|uniref:Uncharacterized protein n=1 Tax=Mycobacterium phage Chris TaxID=2725626 RepID=A0A6M3T8T3_9CAUD|nr:hypothetical protein I5G96_gp056 [Mycobacterium phage Chris]QJD50451.1 hypothetical protein SEA_CHRIS_49 [Mycobacterium phage Chris]